MEIHGVVIGTIFYESKTRISIYESESYLWGQWMGYLKRDSVKSRRYYHPQNRHVLRRYPQMMGPSIF